MKLDQQWIGLYLWVIALAIGYVILFSISVRVFKEIYQEGNTWLIVLLGSLSVVGIVVAKYAKKRCERRAIVSGSKVNCRSEATAAFMLFMVFSSIPLAIIIKQWL